MDGVEFCRQLKRETHPCASDANSIGLASGDFVVLDPSKSRAQLPGRRCINYMKFSLGSYAVGRRSPQEKGGLS
jgi:hypothetical protein